MLWHYSKRKEYRYLDEPNCFDKAPSLSELIRYASQHGLKLRAYQYKNCCDIKNNKVYPILVLLKEDGLSHLAYLERRVGHRFILLDPARGKRSIRDLEFYNIFTGVFLQSFI